MRDRGLIAFDKGQNEDAFLIVCWASCVMQAEKIETSLHTKLARLQTVDLAWESLTRHSLKSSFKHKRQR